MENIFQEMTELGDKKASAMHKKMYLIKQNKRR